MATLSGKSNFQIAATGAATGYQQLFGLPDGDIGAATFTSADNTNETLNIYSQSGTLLQTIDARAVATTLVTPGTSNYEDYYFVPLSSGNIAEIYYGTSSSALSENIYFRVISPTGTPLTAQAQINSAPVSANAVNLSAVELANGNIAFNWEQSDGLSHATRVFTPAGAAAGAATVYDPQGNGASGTERVNSIAAGTDGSYIIEYYDQTDLRYSIFNADGTVRFDNKSALTSATGTGKVIALDNGQYVYFVQDGTAPNVTQKAYFISATTGNVVGGPVSTVTSLNDSNNPNVNYGVSFHSTGGTGFVITSTDASFNVYLNYYNSAGVLVQTVTADGTGSGTGNSATGGYSTVDLFSGYSRGVIDEELHYGTSAATNRTIQTFDIPATPTVSATNIHVSGGTGASGVYKIGDTVTVTWDNSAAGDNNSVSITGVTIDFTQFGGGSAVTASNSNGVWTATYQIAAGSIQATTNRNVAVTATDSAGPTTTSGTNNVTVDDEAPTVSSINRAAGATNPNNATSDSFTVTFSESVTGVDVHDFTVAGVTGTVGSVSGSGTTYTVTVNSVSGTGTLALNLNSSGTGITDTAGNAISGGFTTGQTYTVDNTAPSITSVTLDQTIYKLGDTVTATIQLSGSYDGNGNYTLGSGSTLDGQMLTGVSYNSGNNTLTATFTATSNVSQVTNGTVADSIVVKDALGNASTAHTAGTASSATIDTIAPVLSTATVNGGSLVLTYAETGSGLNGADTPVAAEFTVKDNGNTDSVTGVSYDAANNTVTLTLASAVARADTVTVAYTPDGTVSHELQDTVGNLAATLATTAVTNNTAPTVISINLAGGATALNNATSDSFIVTFSQAVNGVSASNFTLSGTDGTGTIGAPSTGDGGITWTVPVTGVSGNGTLGLNQTSDTGVTAASGGVALTGTHNSDQIYTVDTTPPTVTAAHISVSGGSGTGGAFKIGDTVTATWNNSGTGDNNTDTINAGGVTFDFSQFGGGTAAVATDNGGIWTATSIIAAGSIDTTTAHVAVTATDHVGNATTTSGTAVTVDDIVPVVTAAHISVSGGSGTGGAFKIGDTVTATWNNSGTGDNNTDTINAGGVTFDFSQFGGGTAAVATDNGGIWTATSIITAGSIDTTTAHVAVTATDHVGNATTASGAAVSVDDVQPTATAVATPSSGTEGVGDIVNLTLSFGEAVTIDGASPELTLNDGGHAIYDAAATAALHDASKLVFDYTVGPTDASVASLAITGVTAGTAITDLAGNNANVAASFNGLQVISSVLTANPDSNHVTANQAVSADAAHGVLANDSDTNPTDHLFVSAVDGLAGDVNQPVAGAYGTLTLHADGSYTYNASNMSVGVGVDNFVYTMSDGHGQTSTSTLAVTIIGANESYTQVAAGGSATSGFGNGVLDGSAGNATLTAAATFNAHPVLIGGPGDTLNAANFGQDTFVFNNNFGHDIVNNFHPSLDVIQLQQSQFGSLANVLADIQQVGADSVLALDASHVITLTNTQHTSLTAADFHLV